MPSKEAHPVRQIVSLECLGMAMPSFSRTLQGHLNELVPTKSSTPISEPQYPLARTTYNVTPSFSLHSLESVPRTYNLSLSYSPSIRVLAP